MYRTILEDLLKWKNSRNRKPLLLQGARQVGKTWVLRHFGSTEFESVAYVNFLDDLNMVAAFQGSLDTDRLLDSITLQTGVKIKPSSTLIILDEIQECPRAIMSLKTFAETRPDLHISAAGSLLGVALHSGISYPVGKVNHLMMYPMTFYEFLRAMDETACRAIEQRDYELLNAFSEFYTDSLKKYMFVGGMPGVVEAYLESDDLQEARTQQEILLFDYEHDFSKHATPALTEKIRMLWDSIPAQLGRENKKFIYSAIRKGARARGYEEAIQWLVDAGLLLRVNKISKPGLPLKSYEDRDAFKLYMLDVGLLGAASRLSARSLLEGDALFMEFKGSMTENFVCQQLVASTQIKPFYWSAENSTGEIDFVYDYDGNVVPVEVKASVNLKAKSLRSFTEKYKIDFGLRLSLSPFKEQGWVINLPLYAANTLPNWQA